MARIPEAEIERLPSPIPSGWPEGSIPMRTWEGIRSLLWIPRGYSVCLGRWLAEAPVRCLGLLARLQVEAV